MTRLRTDQACLEAQMQQQIAQNLNAELAVPCPDCFSPAGIACRDSLDRAIRTHLARSVAANRRDTEPCPAPPLSRLEQIQELNAAQESLERASARAFAESLRAEVDRANATCVCCLESPGADGVIAHRPLCFYKTPTASDCAPSPAASAPEAVASTPTRPTCACGQTVWKSDAKACADCSMQGGDVSIDPPIDWKIAADRAETKSDDATECAWSTPTSEGEGWR